VAGNNIYSNQRLKEITGMSAVQAREKGWSSAIHPDDREEVEKILLATMSLGEMCSHEPAW